MGTWTRMGGSGEERHKDEEGVSQTWTFKALKIYLWIPESDRHCITKSK